MAIIELALPVTSIKGSVGGVTFQRNRAGQIMRTRPKTHKFSTTKQQLSHQDHQKFLFLWQQLSFNDKLVWNDYADTWTKPDFFGNDKNLTGQNWFESINRNLETVGSPTVSIPPAHILPENLAGFMLVATSTELKILWFSFFDPADNALFVRLTGPTRRLTNTIQSELRFARIYNPGPYGVLNLTSIWEEIYGINWPPSASISGYRICVSLQTCNIISGLISPAVITCAIVSQNPNVIGQAVIGASFIINFNPGISLAEIGLNFLIY